METKTCTKCGECKPLDAFAHSKKKKCGRASWCKPCHAEHMRHQRLKNGDAIREKDRRRVAENLKKRIAAARAWEMANPDARRASRAKAVAELRPAYVASALRIPTEQLTPELLALKREQILNQRALRELKQTLKDLTNEHEPNH